MEKWKKLLRFLPFLLVLLFIPLFIVAFRSDGGGHSYEIPPERVINRAIASTLTAIEHEMSLSVTGERPPDVIALHRMLNLYGTHNLLFSNMLAPDTYPSMDNGRTVAAFLNDDAARGHLALNKLPALQQLHPLYQQLADHQPRLVNDDGSFVKEELHALQELNTQINTLMQKGDATE